VEMFDDNTTTQPTQTTATPAADAAPAIPAAPAPAVPPADAPAPDTALNTTPVPEVAPATDSAPAMPAPAPAAAVPDDDSLPAPSDTTAMPAAGTDDLVSIKQQALQSLSPLLGQLDQSPQEKFRTTMMMIQASDNQDLIKDAYEAANQITDEKAKAQALLDVVNEINYFTQHGQS
jgi:hypothetical protein